MGEVYKAKDTRLDRIVAIKVLPSHLSDNAERRERFEREARAVSSLNHLNICTLHDVGEQDGALFLVMEYIEGESLMLALAPVCVASGSACNAKTAEPSYVLRALGRSDLEAQAAIRFSFGRYTTARDVAVAADRYCSAVTALRALAAGLD